MRRTTFRNIDTALDRVFLSCDNLQADCQFDYRIAQRLFGGPMMRINATISNMDISR